MRRTSLWRTVLLVFVACSCLLQVGIPTAGASVITTDPSLPPLGSEYRSDPIGQIADYVGFIHATDLHLGSFRNIHRSLIGPDEMLMFDATLSGMVLELGGVASLDGPVTAIVRGKAGQTTGAFPTELLSMTMSGMTPGGLVLVRESPTLRSSGMVAITDEGGGMYRIDSFFDVFTELSVDGGQTWLPDVAGPHHMTLVPEPSTLLLLALGGIALARKVRRG